MQNKSFKKTDGQGNQVINFRDNGDEGSKNFGPKAIVRNSSDPNEMNESG